MVSANRPSAPKLSFATFVNPLRGIVRRTWRRSSRLDGVGRGRLPAPFVVSPGKSVRTLCKYVPCDTLGMTTKGRGTSGSIELPLRMQSRYLTGTLERLDDRFDYPETRWYAIGLAEGRPITVIYTDVDDETRRIISTWKAEKHEEKAYFDHLEAQD